MPRRKKRSKIKLPSPTDKTPPFPKLLRGASGPPPIFPINVPRRRSKFDKYPRIIRIARSIKSLLKVEPDKPVRMPSFPTLAFPRLYTRYSIMKTYTAVSDANGKITVTFPRVFRKIPGVVISPKDAGTWFEHVLSTNEFGFTIQILKTAHAHQHANSGGGGGHDHSTGNSNYAGNHWHYTDDKGGHDHTIATDGGVKTSAATGTYISGGLIADGGAQLTYLHEYSAGCADPPACYISWVITGINDGLDLTTKTHTHTTDIDHSHSESTEPDHYHDTDWDGDHEHTIPNSNTEPNHDHPVPDSNEKEASLLANTSVTFTYFAQEES